MKRIFSILLLFFVLTGCNSTGEKVYDNENAGMDYTTTIYYSPHADDEVLSMGPSILHNLELNKEVIVVLLSKGLASNALDLVNEKLEEEGFPTITREEFGQARVKEFKNSVDALGVKVDNVYVFDLDDGNFTPEDVSSIIIEFEEKYPDSLHNVMSYDDPHSDHAATGEALSGLKKEKKIQNALYHIPIQEHENMIYEGTYEVPENRVHAFENALGAYGKWAPEEGSYSIGYMSVRNYFEFAQKSLESRWHN